MVDRGGRRVPTLTWRRDAKCSVADTTSITIMELADNAIMLSVPGTTNAGLLDPLFWAVLAISLTVAGIAAFPANRWLLGRGKGHAVVHAHHQRQ